MREIELKAEQEKTLIKAEKEHEERCLALEEAREEAQRAREEAQKARDAKKALQDAQLGQAQDLRLAELQEARELREIELKAERI